MTTHEPRPVRSIRKILPRVFQYLVLCLVTIVILVPIVILGFGSLKTTGEMFVSPYTIPNPAHWENYSQILLAPTFWL